MTFRTRPMDGTTKGPNVVDSASTTILRKGTDRPRTSVESVKVNGQIYVAITYPNEDGPTSTEMDVIGRFTGGMYRKLTYAKACEVKGNPELNAAFKKLLPPGTWTYIHPPADPPKRRAGDAYILFHYPDKRGLDVICD